MKTKNITNIIIISALSLSGLTYISGCGSSVKKVEIAKTANPSEEIARLSQDINAGYKLHYDVLAEDDFVESKDYLSDAQEGLRKNKKQEDILDDVAYGRAYLNKAAETAAQRQQKVQGILEARTAALNAGARNSKGLNNQLRDWDDELRDNAKNFDKKLSAKEFSELQRGYLDLELAAIQSTELGTARAMIIGARDGDAKDNTPKTLKQAQISLENAENTVSTNRHNPSAYKSSVERANRDAKFLVDVLATTKRKGSDLDEVSAVKIVRQNYEINKLRTDVDTAESAIGQMDDRLSEKDREISATHTELNQANATVNVQKAIENARGQFTDEEAQVFQQGDKLLIRLNSMAFASGRADLPTSSLSVLAKVKTVAEELNSSALTVEGHTDSTGGAKANVKLSEARASAVAEYFQTNGLDGAKIDSVGYGFKKPIATNKSASGREQNRRVDIVITPGSTSL